jgi:hypothetical protein
MLAESDLKLLLHVANVDMIADLTSCFIDKEMMMAFPTKWALSINLRCHGTIAGSVNTVATMDSIDDLQSAFSINATSTAI